MSIMLGLNTGRHSVHYDRRSYTNEVFLSSSSPAASDLEDILSKWKSGSIDTLSVFLNTALDVLLCVNVFFNPKKSKN